MTNEEKKAIEFLKGVCTDDCASRPYIVEPILNLIEKQSKEIEYLKSQIPIDKIFYYSYKDFISKDKIKAFIKEELPDDEIMETCQNYDTNGVLIREKLESLLEEE